MLRRDEADPSESLDRLEELREELALNVVETAPAVAALLSLPTGDRYRGRSWGPEELKRRIHAVQADLLRAAAMRCPVLFVVEDLHWADPTTLAVLGELAGTR